VTGNSGLPWVSEEAIEGILTRDSFNLLGVESL
jgi:hypothetical protein